MKLWSISISGKFSYISNKIKIKLIFILFHNFLISFYKYVIRKPSLRLCFFHRNPFCLECVLPHESFQEALGIEKVVMWVLWKEFEWLSYSSGPSDCIACLSDSILAQIPIFISCWPTFLPPLNNIFQPSEPRMTQFPAGMWYSADGKQQAEPPKHKQDCSYLQVSLNLNWKNSYLGQSPVSTCNRFATLSIAESFSWILKSSISLKRSHFR